MFCTALCILSDELGSQLSAHPLDHFVGGRIEAEQEEEVKIGVEGQEQEGLRIAQEIALRS